MKSEEERTNTSCLFSVFGVFDVLDLLIRRSTGRFASIEDVVLQLFCPPGGSLSVLRPSRVRAEGCITGECFPARVEGQRDRECRRGSQLAEKLDFGKESIKSTDDVRVKDMKRRQK